MDAWGTFYPIRAWCHTFVEIVVILLVGESSWWKWRVTSKESWVLWPSWHMDIRWQIVIIWEFRLMLPECWPKDILYLRWHLTILQILNPPRFISNDYTQYDIVWPLFIAHPKPIPPSNIIGNIKFILVTPPLFFKFHKDFAINTHFALRQCLCFPRWERWVKFDSIWI